jgi:N-acetylglucosaminyl-diphospho-decaprenol L-rhamnosyltransferase
MDVATVIVNYRTASATIEAVESLRADLARFHDSVVVVVDNDSKDGSLAELQKAFANSDWGDRVVVVPSGHNGGFGSGVNFGIRHVLRCFEAPRCFYVLNPDATIQPGALNRLMEFMSEHPDAGLLGSMVHNQGADIVGGFRFPSILGELETTAGLGLVSALLRNHALTLDAKESRRVDWVSGASMLFRNEALSAAGLFDEDFFLYFEEVDLARRVTQAGWNVYVVADAVVNHLAGLSTGFKDEARPMPRYWFESRRRYYVKHHGWAYAVACDAAWACGHILYKVKNQLLRRDQGRRPHFGRDLLRYSLTNVGKPAPQAPQNRNRSGVAAGARSG